MARFPQAACLLGSKRWIQHFVNDRADVLNECVGAPIQWLSPLKNDQYAEYRDQAFLERLGIMLPRRSLSDFWPSDGPQWDALGRAESGEIVLVEAKAHLNELLSPPMSASTDASITRIQLSLREAAQGLGVPEGFDWSKQSYQYANRLAHAYLLKVLNGVLTRLVFVYFVGDADMGGPTERQQWDTAIATVYSSLGISHVPSFVTDIFIDVRKELRRGNAR